MPITFQSSSEKFQFLSEDVDTQLRVSRRIAECARGLDVAIKKLGEGQVQDIASELRSIRNELILVGRELAKNASNTSSTATEVISEASARST